MAEESSANESTYYGILGVPSTASYEDIKAAFYALARQSHPDKQQQQQQQVPRMKKENNLELDFKLIQVAWETLRSEETKRLYDDDLQQQALQQKVKIQGALGLGLDDLEAAEDDQTGEIMYVYDCRCGEELIFDVPSSYSISNKEGAVLMDCPGCCFVYKLETSNSKVDE